MTASRIDQSSKVPAIHATPPARLREARHMAGVTLIELVVTLSVAVILMSIAVPSFQGVMRTNRIAALTNELSTALQYARSEAVTRGKTVTVCKSANVIADSPICSTSANWQDGWLVKDGNNTLMVGQPSISSATITSSTDSVNFSSMGQLESRLELELCIAPDKRVIIIEGTGRVHVKKGNCT